MWSTQKHGIDQSGFENILTHGTICVKSIFSIVLTILGHAESNAGRCQAQKSSEVLLFGLQRYCRFRRKTAKISTMYGIKIVSLTPKKIIQKVFQWILLGLSVLINILKVYQNWSIRKVFFSKWRPRWPTNL